MLIFLYLPPATQPRPSPAVKLCTMYKVSAAALLTSGIQPYSESIELVSHKTTERDADIVEMSEEARANSERHRVPEEEREADGQEFSHKTNCMFVFDFAFVLAFSV